MLEQVSTSVKFVAFYTASKTGKTGLTVTVDLYDPSGSQIVTGGSATAIGGGLYAYTLSTNNSAEGEYAAIFKTTDSTVDSQHIPSLWVLGRAGVENLDASVSSRSTLTAAQVNTEADTALSDVGLTTTITGRIDQAISTRLAAADYTAPSAAPTVAEIRQELDTNSTKLANLDATVSSRLAGSAYSVAPTTAQIATAVEGSLLNEADGQAVLNAIVGAIGNTNLSEVSLVAAVRADLERVGGKLDSIPTTAAPTAAANATAVWGAASRTITGGTVTTLTNSPSVPSAASIASATRTELTTELGRLDAAVSTRLATSGYTAPTTPPTAAANATAVRTELATELARVDVATSSRLATSGYTAPTTPPTVAAIRSEMDSNSTKLANLDATVSSRLASSVSTNITAIKAKTDLLNTDRLGQVATTSIVGNLIAQSNS